MSNHALVSAALLTLMMTSSGLSAQILSDHALSPTERAMTLQLPAARTVRGPLLQQPPPARLLQRSAFAAEQRRVPLAGAGLGDDDQALPEQTSETGGVPPPGSVVILRDSALTGVPAGTSSRINEPNVGSQGDGILNTHNWYAETSTDNGATFTYVDPDALFPHSPSEFAGGFCCVQRVAQDASRDLIFWLLEYFPIGSSPNRANGLRLAVAQGQAGLATNSWVAYDLTPSLFGFTEKLFDFPHMQVSADYLYFTANLLNADDNTFAGALVARMPLAALATGGSVTINTFTTSEYGNILAVNGAQAEGTRAGRTTMYFAAVLSTTSLKVLTWPDTDAAPTATTISGLPAIATGTFACPGPDGLDPCTRADTRMQTGWITDTELGLMFASAQNGAARPFPYTRVVILDPATLTVIAQPDIFSTTSAWLYPALAVNQRGHLGGTIDNLGGDTLPAIRAVIRDDLSPDVVTSGWETVLVAASTAGTAGLWGDYNGAATHEKYPDTWLAAGHTQTGGPDDAHAVTHNYWFGRARDAPGQGFALTVTKAGTGTGTVTSNPAGIDCGTNCAANYANGTVVTLTAAPAAGSVFSNWSGACTGAGSCTVTMDAAKSVTATFNTNGSAPGLSFYTVTPCRILDTRSTGPALSSGVTRVIPVTGLCGIPSDAVAVSFNATAVAPGSGGYVTLFPGNAAVPSTSTINFAAGKTRANNAVLALATDASGTLAAQASLSGGGQVDLLVDVNGYLK